ncbi:hypothetical protein ALC56_02588 [Trachymyrmex septentrionalis]|uniref:Uncharacterized protein n=1 Tax=Trachymyrmex septentrionalis TaxID=34720 RepID=A0A195FQT2_9HYME|nr:hypothetical protein ALC56_02588 [Trachymyrmex septentrionalis]
MNPTAPRHSFPGTPGAEAINEERFSHQSTPDFILNHNSLENSQEYEQIQDFLLQRRMTKATGYIEPSSCTTDIRKRDKTETGRDRNGMKRDGTADRVRKCGSITMAGN